MTREQIFDIFAGSSGKATICGFLSLQPTTSNRNGVVDHILAGCLKTHGVFVFSS